MFACLKGAVLRVIWYQDAGGILALTDVYCRVNRARGLEVISIFLRAYFSAGGLRNGDEIAGPTTVFLQHSLVQG